MKYLHSHPAAVAGFLTTLLGWLITNQSHLVAVTPPAYQTSVGGFLTIAGAGAAMLGLSPLSNPHVPTLESTETK